jgi:DNA-binding transcriptional ArsR family regulator
MPDDRVDPMQAMAEPSRRAILDELCEGERAVGELVLALSLSQPAVSQHLKVLLTAGLVSVRQDGRRRLYRAEPAGLERLHQAIEQYWRAALRQMRHDLGEPERPHRGGGDTPPSRDHRERR